MVNSAIVLGNYLSIIGRFWALHGRTTWWIWRC